MPVTFQCPVCGGLLSVPRKLVGSSIRCPVNGCTIEVQAGSDTDSGPPPAMPPQAFGAPVAVVAAPAAAANGRSAVQAPSEAPTWFSRNVARPITSAQEAGAVQLTTEGKLPELQLEEGRKRPAAEKGSGSHPLLLVGTLCLSLSLSGAMLLMDLGPSRTVREQKAQARSRLTEFYRQTDDKLLPYQQHLREAQLAYSRGDDETQRRMYRRVLALLRAEGRSRLDIVTGSPSKDEELEELLAVLLSEE